MPAGDVAVLDQKHAVVAVQHYGADPERHAAGESPIQMKNPPQQRLKPLSQILQVHRDRTLENPDTAFDPCAGTASLPRDSIDSQDITRLSCIGSLSHSIRLDAADGGIHAGAPVRSASRPAARRAVARPPRQARVRLSQLDA